MHEGIDLSRCDCAVCSSLADAVGVGLQRRRHVDHAQGDSSAVVVLHVSCTSMCVVLVLLV